MTAIITTNIEDARHQANIATKAAALFGELGYTYKAMTSPGLFFVYPPQADRDPYIVDTVNPYCTCPGHAETGICSHLIAMTDEVEYLASVAAREDSENPPIDACA